jgi:hypothetical protein
VIPANGQERSSLGLFSKQKEIMNEKNKEILSYCNDAYRDGVRRRLRKTAERDP